MKKLLIDTNIIIDLLSRREKFYSEAATLFSLADTNVIKLSVLSLTFANTNYILSKEKKPNDAKTILRKLRLLVDILPLDDKIIGLALNDDSFTDFEDALQYFSAIENNQDNIITRNLRDFKNSRIPVMTARQFIETLE